MTHNFMFLTPSTQTYVGPVRTCPALQRALAARPATAAIPAAAAAASTVQPAPCILWFKHDLRLDDHPGLQAALQSGGPLLPVYCFDPAHYSSLLQMPDGIAGAWPGLLASLLPCFVVSCHTSSWVGLP